MRPFVEVKGPVSSTNRAPTAGEMKESTHRRIALAEAREDLKQLETKIRELVESCPHVVSIDNAGWPHDTRECYGCGKYQGTV